MAEQTLSDTYPNQRYGWVKENDGTWSLYAPDGTLVIASRDGRAQVSEPTSDFDIANKKYGDAHWSDGGGLELVDLRTVTTDQDEFFVIPIIDCEQPCIVYIKCTLTSYVADGETIEPVLSSVYFDLADFKTDGIDGDNPGGVAQWWLTDRRGWDVNTFMSATGQWIGITLPTERYVAPWLEVFQNQVIYAGANHPTGTFLVQTYRQALST